DRSARAADRPRGRRESCGRCRESRDEEISAEVAAAGDQRAAVQRDSLADAEQPVPGARRGRRRTDAVVGDLDLERRAVPPEPNARSTRAAVPDNVRQRLLDDAVGRYVGPRAERPRSALHHELDVEPCRTDIVNQVVEARETGLRDERLLVL